MAKLTFIREVMKIKITVIILLLSTPALSSYVWTQRASFPGAARFEAASFAIGTNGYISCGIGFSNTKYNDCWEWNSVANIWTQKHHCRHQFVMDVVVSPSMGKVMWFVVGLVIRVS